MKPCVTKNKAPDPLGDVEHVTTPDAEDGRGEPFDIQAFDLDAALPLLTRGFITQLGPEIGGEALSEALAYYAAHPEKVRGMANPVGYLFRVGSRRGLRARLRPRPLDFPAPAEVGIPEVALELVETMARLSTRQRTCVTLVHAFGYRNREVAEMLGISTESVQTHCRRALRRLRSLLEEEPEDGAL